MDVRSSLPRITLFLSVSLACVALTQLAPGERRVAEHAPLSPTRVEHLLEQDDADTRFDGTIHGWRVGPSASLAREGLYEPPGNVPCKTRSRFLDPTRPTSLDLTIRPEPKAVVGSRARKVGCADGTNFALVEYELKTRLGPGSLTIERRRVAKKAWSAFAGHRKVQAATINDRPAIAIHCYEIATIDPRPHGCVLGFGCVPCARLTLL